MRYETIAQGFSDVRDNCGYVQRYFAVYEGEKLVRVFCLKGYVDNGKVELEDVFEGWTEFVVHDTCFNLEVSKIMQVEGTRMTQETFDPIKKYEIKDTCPENFREKILADFENLE